MLKCTYIIDINACLGQVGGFVALTDLDISFMESGNKTGTIQFEWFPRTVINIAPVIISYW